MDWNQWPGVVTAICAVVSTFFIVRTARKFSFSTWLKAQEVFMEPRFTKARGMVLPHYWEPEREWKEADKAAAAVVCRKMDELAHLVPFICEKKVLETWDDPIGKCWFVVKDIVKTEQEKVKWPTKWSAFEALGEKALARVKEREEQFAQGAGGDGSTGEAHRRQGRPA